MTRDARKLAELLRRHSAGIVDRFMAPREGGWLSAETPAATRQVWRRLGVGTIDRIARYLEAGLLPKPEDRREEMEVMKWHGITAETILAARNDMEQSLVETLLREERLDGAEAAQLAQAARAVISVGVNAFVRYAEKELEAEHAGLLAAIEGLSVALFRADADSTILSVNWAGANALGAESPEELIGRRFGDFYADPADRQRVREALISKGSLQYHRFRLKRLDGQIRWCETNLRANRSPDGKLLGFSGFAREITEQVEAENSRQLLAEIMDRLPLGVFRVNGEGLILDVNAGFVRLMGVGSAAELVGKSAGSLIVDQADLASILAEVEAKGEALRSRVRVRRPDGRIVWTEGYIRAVRDETGRMVAREGFFRDVTVLIEAENATRQAEGRYQRLVENLGREYFFYAHGVDGVFFHVSPSVTAILGFSPEEFRTHYTKYLTDSPINQEVVHHTERSIQGQPQPPYEVEIYHKNGNIHRLEVAEVPVFDADGKVIAVEGIAHDVTGRKRMEWALEAERGRLNQIVTSLGAGLSLLDRDLRIVWYNEQHAAWFGPLEQARGKRCHEVYHGRAEPCPNCPTRETLSSGQPCVRDVPTPTAKGEIVFRLTTTPVLDPAGQVVQVLELVQDVTAERAAEAERRRSNDMLAGILGSATEYGIIATDAEGLISYFSEGAERLFGLKPAETVGRVHAADLWPPETRAALAASLADLARGGRYEEETELLRSRGLTFVARVSASCRRGGGGELAGYTFVIRDVTEERAAQKLVTLLAHAIESSREGVMLTDMSGVITYVNPAMSGMTGREPAELLGKDLSVLYSKETPGEEIRSIARSTLAGGWNGEVTAVRKDGTTFPAYVTTSLVRDERGRAVAMVGLSRDISREKSLQRRLYEQEQRHLAELERQVQERTAELERAYRDLQKLDAMKDRFLANVSHELRTPLVSGVGYIELILHEGLGPINDDARKGLQVAHRNLLRLVNLIDDLLTFTRLGSGKDAMVLGRFDLAQMVNDCLLDLKVRAGKKNLRVRMDVEPGLPPVEADEENVHRIFTNLLSNAEKFTGEDAEVSVGARRLSDSRVEVRIADNGVGIPADELEAVFERFYRSKRTPSPRYGGTGIGLSLVKEILAAHGCTVRAESPGERGTTIAFTLPLAAAAPAPPRRAPAPAGEARRRPAALLVVDDDPDVHELFRNIFKDSPDRLVSAPGGEQALRLAAAEDFDLIFLDVSMEGLDGLEVLRRLRAADRTAHVPVYFLTARTEERTRAEAHELKADGFLTKPFSVADVRAAVEDVLAGSAPE